MVSRFLQLIRHRQAVFWTLVVGLGLTAAVGWELHREALELDRQRLARRVAEIQNQLDARLEKSEMLLNNLRDYLMWRGEPRKAVLQRWCYDSGLTINCMWIHGILIATNKHRIEWRERFSGSPGSWDKDQWFHLYQFMDRQPIECEIALGINATNSMRHLGDYNLRAFGHSRDQFAIAIKASRPGMSERRTVMLNMNSNGVVGTLFYIPVYSPDMAPLIAESAAAGHTKWSDRAALHWLHLRSMIVAPVNYDTLLDALHGDAPRDVELELFSSIEQTEKRWLSNAKGLPRAADPAFKAYLTDRQTWRMYGQKFSIFFYTTPLFEAQSPRRLAKIAMAAGTVLTLLATTLVGVALRSRDQQAAMADQIREARDALAAAQKAREQFSRDLHDGTIQSLYAVQLGLGHLSEKQLDLDPSRARREFATIRKELDGVIAEVRNFVNAGATDRNRAVNFTSVLSALVQRAQAGASAKITVLCDDKAVSFLGAGDAVQLSNIVREAISNSLRHAKPANIMISLRRDHGSLILQMKDDGSGFDPNSPQRFGVGLKSMQSRAQEMGGTFVIESSPTEGTRIQISIPCQDSAGT